MRKRRKKRKERKEMGYYENIRRGEIFFVELGREVDHIQAGRRPVVVVSNNTGNQFAPHVLVCPLTQVRKDLPTHVRLQTRKPSYVLCETILAIDKRRLEDYQGKANVKKAYNNLASRYSALKEIVEKQIKVEKICTIAQENGGEVRKFYTCPICNRTVLAGQKYCGRCGQKLLVKEGE